MGSSIWSADPQCLLDMPAVTFARFFDNHGLLDYGDQPSWRTVAGGSQRYVDAILAPLGAAVRLSSPVAEVTRGDDGVELHSDMGPERFDHVVLATHSDQALQILSDPSVAEREVLGLFGTSQTEPHSTPTNSFPKCRPAWASWNYHRLADQPQLATLTYRLASLQGTNQLTRSW